MTAETLIAGLRTRLSASREARPADFGERAAVAAILLPRDDTFEILLIRRAERPTDLWSGHMAFPGGRRSPEDRDLLATAVRETEEEVGLDLARHGELVGR